MDFRIRSLGLTALVLLGSEVATARDARIPDASSSVQAELYRVVQTFIEAANRSDAETLMALVVQDPRVTSVANGKVTTGWETIRDQVLRTNTIPADIHVTLSGRSHQFQIARDVALFVAPYTLTAVTSERTITLHAVMTLVLQKLDGRWKVFHEHNSAVPPEQ